MKSVLSLALFSSVVAFAAEPSEPRRALEDVMPTPKKEETTALNANEQKVVRDAYEAFHPKPKQRTPANEGPSR